MHTITPRTIVVGVDYSDTGAVALRSAFHHAHGGTVHVVHVIDAAIAAGAPMMPVAVDVPPLGEDVRQLHAYVEKQVGDFQDDGGEPPTIVSHVAIGAPARELAQAASDLEADMLVVGTHGRTGVARLLLGSVAEGVIRHSPCPVLVERRRREVAEKAGEKVPVIEPPCPRCVETRRDTAGAELWCAQHREKHGPRHVWHSRSTPAAFPSNHPGLGSIT